MGGWGAGKSLANIYRFLRLSMDSDVPRHGLLSMFTRKMVDGIFMRELESILIQFLPDYLWEINSYKGIVYTRNRSKPTQWSILETGSLDDPEKLTGYNYDLIFVDECHKGLTLEAYRNLKGRLRHGKEQFISITGNPPDRRHWIYQDIALAHELGTAPADRHFIRTASDDNPYLPQAYLDDLAALPEDMQAIYRRGEFGTLDGACFKSFDPTYHVQRFGVDETWRVFRAVDFGFASPFCCLWAGLDREGTIWIFDEVYEAEVTVADWVPRLKARDYQIEGTFADPENPGDKADFEQMLGERWKTADNDVWEGVKELIQRFIVRKGQAPRLVIHERCRNLIREVSSLQWDRDRFGNVNRQRPKKGNDHACDCLRYVAMGIRAHTGASPYRPRGRDHEPIPRLR